MLFNVSNSDISLNFKVVSGATQPASPKENTIWINTSTAVSGYTFSGISAPGWAMAEGWVYIRADIGKAAGSPEFNALRKNEILINPGSAKQYVGNQWVNVEAKIYQGGKWVDWKTYIYNHGDKCTDIGGNWVPMAKNISADGRGAQAPAISFGTTSMVITQEAMGGIAYKENRIDLSGVSTLKVKGSVTNAASLATWRSLNVWPSLGSYIRDNRAAYLEFGLTNGDLDLSLDVSGLTGTYYIGFGLYNTPATLTIEEVELV